jgi:TrmH family RNA methyltransferase
MSLSNIRIVLIRTSHPGNIGSTARAMKTMGLSDLCLVNPKKFPDPQANIMSSSAEDILEQATLADSLQQAVADCHVVIGTSARHLRTLSWDTFDSRHCGQFVAEQLANSKKVALIFGRERSGLSNEELSFCHHLVHIPTNSDYSSLNIASAVQILSYECRMGSTDSKESSHQLDEELISNKEMEGFYQHLEKALIEVEFLDPENPRYLMPRLRRMYGRIAVTRSELSLLRGMLSAFQGRKFTRREK